MEQLKEFRDILEREMATRAEFFIHSPRSLPGSPEMVKREEQAKQARKEYEEMANLFQLLTAAARMFDAGEAEKEENEQSPRVKEALKPEETTKIEI